MVVLATCKFYVKFYVNLDHFKLTYPTLEEIQVEVASSIMQLAPAGCSGQIPYLAIGSGLGEQKTIYSGNSTFSGDFIVEDVVIDDHYFRRLIFLNNQAVIQSEVRLKNVSANEEEPKWVVDIDYVASTYHFYMALAIVLYKKNEPSSTLVLGLGGGSLCNLILKLFLQAEVTAVDIDPAIVDVAKEYFGLPDSDRLHVEVCDGLEYIKTCEEKQKKFDVIMIDVDAKSESLPMSCPPEEFLSDDTLDNYEKILNKSGVLVVNIVCRDDTFQTNIIERIRKKFPLVAESKMTADVNLILLATPNKDLTKDEWKVALQSYTESINRTKRGIEDDICELDDYFNDLVL